MATQFCKATSFYVQILREEPATYLTAIISTEKHFKMQMFVFNFFFLQFQSSEEKGYSRDALLAFKAQSNKNFHMHWGGLANLHWILLSHTFCLEYESNIKCTALFLRIQIFEMTNAVEKFSIFI